MTSGGGEGRTNWESVTLIRIYLNITWTQQGLRIGYFDFSQVHSRRYFSKFPRYTAGFIFQISQVHSRLYFPNFPRYTAGDISPNFPRYTAGDISPNFPRYTAGDISPFCPRYTAGVICHKSP